MKTKEAYINVKIQGVRGGDSRWSENKGRVELFVDNGSDSWNDFISVDAFEGRGDSYKRRSQSLIRVLIQGNEWLGTIDELSKKLFGEASHA